MSRLGGSILSRAMAGAGNAQAITNLAIGLAEQGKDIEARATFEKALALDPEWRAAHHGLALLLIRSGEFEAAMAHNARGYSGCPPPWPSTSASPIRVLVIESALGGNVPTAPFIEASTFEKFLVVAELFAPEFLGEGFFRSELPAHDIVFNAVGDADRCGGVFPLVENILAMSKAPVLNPPSRLRDTGRAEMPARLGGISGVRAGRAAWCPRDLLLQANASAVLAENGFTFPLLLRAPGFHTGEHFEKIETPADLAKAPPGELLLVLEFIDSRSADGNFRKYRALFIAGEIYPLHLAVSARWKVHYFSADMGDSQAFRDEDAAYLNDMPRVVGERAVHALQSINAALALDYGGIDFAIAANGDVVVFEANTTMVIVPPPAGDKWAYRVAPVARARDAARALLVSRA